MLHPHNAASANRPIPAPASGLLRGVVLAALAGALALQACNTTEGVGKDIKAAGAGIEDAAKDAK